VQALASLQRDKQNLEVKLGTAVDGRNVQRSACDKLQATLGAVQARLKPQAQSQGRPASPAGQPPLGARCLCNAWRLSHVPLLRPLVLRQNELHEVRSRYEQLKQQSVAEVASRVAEKVRSDGAGLAPRATPVPRSADDDLRRTQHALLREREERLRLERELSGARARAEELEGALLAEQERANHLTRSLLAGIDQQRDSLVAAEVNRANEEEEHAASAHAQAQAQAEQALPLQPFQSGSAAAAALRAAGAPVSAARMAEAEAYAREVDGARLAAERELGFLRGRLRGVEEELKASREQELKAKSKFAALHQSLRGGRAAAVDAVLAVGSARLHPEEQATAARERNRADAAEAKAVALATQVRTLRAALEAQIEAQTRAIAAQERQQEPVAH